MKNKVILTLLALFPLLFFAQYSKKPFQRKVFIENKGQFKNTLPKVYQDFDYAIDNGTQILFKNNTLIYHFTQTHEKEWMEEELRESERAEFKTEEEEEREREKFKPTHQYIQLKWIGANSKAKIVVENVDEAKYGYGVDWEVSKKGHTIFCKGYKKLTLKNLYEGIDVEYFFTENEGEIKYNILANEGADLTQVKFKYEGANAIMDKGVLKIPTLLGEIIEFAPVSFYTDSKEKINSSFVLDANGEITFKIAQTLNKKITIDPLIAVPGLGGQAPVDNGVDQWGNHYVTSAQYILEKYTPAGNLVFSNSVYNGGGGWMNLYGDMVTASTGDCYFNTVWGGGGSADAIAVDANGQALWSSFGITECWRFVLNECYGQVYSLTGYRHSASGFATINSSNGALSNYSQQGSCCYDPHCGVVDDNGDVYSVASNPATIHRWSPTNTSIATYPSPIPFGYASGYAGMQGYNGMAKLGGDLYLHNGSTIAKVNKLTGALVGQRAVPNGVKSSCGGIYITSCGYLLIGSTDGVYLFDNNLNQIDFRATNGPVYDLVYNEFNQNFAVCGPGHVTEVDFNIPPCIFETHPDIVPSCNGTASGSIKLNLGGGVPSYTYTWSGNGLVANTDSVGNLLPGTYKCVYSDSRCPVPTVDSIEITVPVQTVQASFTANDVCFGEDVYFTNTSTTDVGGITNIEWNFDDGIIEVAANPVHTYLQSRGYNVKLVITATNECKDSVDTQLVTVNPLPVASFSSTRECNNVAVPFTSNSTVSSGSIASWNWVFDDDSTSTLENPSHQFPIEEFPFLSSYNVSLTVVTDKGCVDDTTIEYTPYPLPKAKFSVDNACVNTPIQFTGLSEVVAPDALNPLVYSFGDGSALVNMDNPIYTYSSPGDYTVTIIATSNNGCVDDTALTITIYPEPIASFSATEICENEPPTQFTNLSTVSSGAIVGSNWFFGNGTSALTNPSYNFEQSGVYNVTLTVVSDYNCQNTTTLPVEVKAAPQARFVVDNPEGCDEHCVQFTNTSITNANSFVSSVWSFGNRTSSLDESPNICFLNKSAENDSSYNVELIMQNNLGCYDTLFLEDYITVYHNPIADFTPSALEENMYESEFFFANDAIGADGYIWTFGDGDRAEDFEPTHVYGDTGVYFITQVAYTLNNCMDTIAKPIKVVPVISIYIPNTFTPDGDGDNDIFKYKGYGIVKDNFEFYIFDRWGTQLFFTNQMDRGWDGTYKGELLQQDTYIYKLICTDYFGEVHKREGHVNLIK